MDKELRKSNDILMKKDQEIINLNLIDLFKKVKNFLKAFNR